MDMRRRIILAIVAALVIASAATFFLYSKIQAAQNRQLPTVKLVAAVRALPAGAPLGADSVTLVDWPAASRMEGSHAKVDEVIGRSLIYPINQNQPILDTDLALPGSGIGLTVKIPEGMRAVSVRSNDVVGVAGFLYPGSHVDVLVISRPETGQEKPLSQTILQNVEVLTAGQRIEPDPTGKAETVNVVTLLLAPEDGQKLVLATQQGTIQFVLRNGADQHNVQTKAVRMADLIGGPKPPTVNAAPKKVVKVKVKVEPPNFYEVETVSAGKRNVDKFAEPAPPAPTQ